MMPDRDKQVFTEDKRIPAIKKKAEKKDQIDLFLSLFL